MQRTEPQSLVTGAEARGFLLLALPGWWTIRLCRETSRKQQESGLWFCGFVANRPDGQRKAEEGSSQSEHVALVGNVLAEPPWTGAYGGSTYYET